MRAASDRGQPYGTTSAQFTSYYVAAMEPIVELRNTELELAHQQMSETVGRARLMLIGVVIYCPLTQMALLVPMLVFRRKVIFPVWGQRATQRRNSAPLRVLSAAWVRGNRNMLLRVLNDLLLNAIEFSPPGGKVDVVLQGKDALWCLSIRDHDLGIASDQLVRLFQQPFIVRILHAVSGRRDPGSPTRVLQCGRWAARSR